MGLNLLAFGASALIGGLAAIMSPRLRADLYSRLMMSMHVVGVSAMAALVEEQYTAIAIGIVVLTFGAMSIYDAVHAHNTRSRVTAVIINLEGAYGLHPNAGRKQGDSGGGHAARNPAPSA